MKRIIIIFTIILSILTYIISFNKFDIESINKFNNLEIELCEPFFIPKNNVLSDYNKVGKIIKNVSKQFNVNIYRKSVSYNGNDSEDVKYILINNNKTKYIKSLNLDKSVSLDDLNKNKFISSYNTNDHNQIGMIYDFANNDKFKIKSFDVLFKTLSVSGVYYVDLSSGTTYEEFLNTFVNEINKSFKTEYSIEDFKYTNNEINNTNKNTMSILKYINIILIILSITIIIFYIFRNAKKISLYKLNGVSNINIWMELIQSQIIKSYGFTSIIILILSILLKLPLKFIASTIFNQILYLLIFTIFLMIPFILVIKSNIVLNVKNKTNDIYLICLNLISKIVIISVISSFFIGILSDTHILFKNLNNINQWEISKDYGVIYPVFYGDDSPDDEYCDLDLTGKLYNYLNKKGALFVDATEYEDDMEIDPDFNRHFTIKANPNYIKNSGIKDIDGNFINISEDETSWIVLVPEKYKKQEEKILEDTKIVRKQCYDFEFGDDIENKSNEDGLIDQEIKIIWIKNDQEVFSFHTGVKKDNGNMIKNPFIEVITENNSLATDKWGTWGDGESSPLKVKLINNSTIDTYEDLLPLLKELELDDNLPTIINLNDLVLLNIENLKDSIKTSFWITSTIFTVVLLIIIQNNIIIFNKYKQKFIIKRSLGIGLFKSYKEYSVILIGTYMLQNILQVILNGNISKEFLAITLSIYILDTLTILAIVYILEHKNKIKILKGV